MIPYEILITSAARPHLLLPTLGSLLDHLDQPPARLLIHDDAAFRPGSVEADHRWMQVKSVLGQVVIPCETLLHHADPPRRLGLALTWLILNTTADYVLYTQDDFVTVRDLPITRALAVMAQYGLHQIRFNKRATLGQKDTWQGVWKKEEREFSADREVSARLRAQPMFLDMDPTNLPDWHCGSAACSGHGQRVTLTVADHWYFQTGLWRTSVIRAALAWLTASPERRALFAQVPAEEAINAVLDGRFGSIPGLTVPHFEEAHLPQVRAETQRTFIWGPIGEDRYIRHIGTDPDDWAGDHAREVGELDRRKTAQAWAEIASYGGMDRDWLSKFPPLTAGEQRRLTEGHWLNE